MMPVVEDGDWLRLEDDSVIGGLRRSLAGAASRVGFGEARVAELAVAATEMATNARRHATDASGLVRIRRDGTHIVVELVILDGGPGMASVDAMFEDGVSSGGTFGIGLGVVRRIANRFDIFSLPNHGTVSIASFLASADDHLAVPTIDGITRPISGEEVCGDAWAAATGDVRTSLILADGLGHGPLARRASRAAIDTFLDDPWGGPAEILARADQALGDTRGAAVSLIDHDRDRHELRFAGVGNVAGRICQQERESSLVPSPGIVGQHRRQIREVVVATDPDALVVLHTDGLTSRWRVATFPGLFTRAPGLVCSVLLRDAGVRHDDAAVVAARVS
jgi:anti-sigma regulatory factor (Ser/Thr protein kinase)